MTIAAAPTFSLESAEQHFVLGGMEWSSYEAILQAVGDRHVFVTYDQGRVELMSPSYEHDSRGDRIGAMVREIADGLSIGLRGGGSTTFHRKDLDRGLEPDKCFWIAHEPVIRYNKSIDLSIDPPPDLCVEVEISRRLLDRIAIYAALGVPELWRDDGQRLRTFALSADGVYVETPASAAFPSMSALRLNRYLGWSTGLDEMTWARKVRRAAKKHRT